MQGLSSGLLDTSLVRQMYLSGQETDSASRRRQTCSIRRKQQLQYRSDEKKTTSPGAVTGEPSPSGSPWEMAQVGQLKSPPGCWRTALRRLDRTPVNRATASATFGRIVAPWDNTASTKTCGRVYVPPSTAPRCS